MKRFDIQRRPDTVIPAALFFAANVHMKGSESR